MKTRARKTARGGGGPDREKLNPTGQVWQPRDEGDKYTVHHFRTLRTIFGIPGNLITPKLDGTYLSFDQLSNYGLYTALFDQYRIDCWEVIFDLKGNVTGNESFPRLTVFPDFDDASAPATLQNVQGHPRAVQHVFTPAKPHFSVKLVPRLAMATYGPVSSLYGSNAKPMFIDSNSPSAQHFGYKYSIENHTNGSNSIEVSYRVWFTCRNPL